MPVKAKKTMKRKVATRQRGRGELEYTRHLKKMYPQLGRGDTEYIMNHIKSMHGEGFFGDVGNWIKHAAEDTGNWVKDAAVNTGNFIKDHKLVSTILTALPDPRLKAAGVLAGQLGVGRARRDVAMTMAHPHTIRM